MLRVTFIEEEPEGAAERGGDSVDALVVLATVLHVREASVHVTRRNLAQRRGQ